MLKRTTFLALSLLSFLFAGAQTEKQADPSSTDTYTSIYNKVSKVERHNKAFQLSVDFAASARSERDERTKVWNNRLAARHLRINLQGQLTPHLFYRFRQVLDRDHAMQQTNRLTNCTDFMFMTYHFNPHHFVSAGKIAQLWGGYEFDANPLFVYDYSDFLTLGNTNGFVVGAHYGFAPTPHHEFIVQITNAYSHNFDEEMQRYKYAIAPAKWDTFLKTRKSNAPFTYSLGWNGSLFGGHLTTRWGGGMVCETKRDRAYFVGLGQRLNFSRFQMTVDYMGEKDDLDHLGIATAELGNICVENYDKDIFQTGLVRNTLYHTFLTKLEYQPVRQFNLWFKGGYELADVRDVKVIKTGAVAFKNYRKAYQYAGGIEYRPLRDQNLRLFLAYMGKHVSYSRFAQSCGLKNHNQNRIELGFMYQIRAF